MNDNTVRLKFIVYTVPCMNCYSVFVATDDEELNEEDELGIDGPEAGATISLLFFSFPHFATAFSKSNSLRQRPFKVMCSKAFTLLVVRQFLSVVLVCFIALKPLSHSALLIGRDIAQAASLESKGYTSE